MMLLGMVVAVEAMKRHFKALDYDTPCYSLFLSCLLERSVFQRWSDGHQLEYQLLHWRIPLHGPDLHSGIEPILQW